MMPVLFAYNISEHAQHLLVGVCAEEVPEQALLRELQGSWLMI